MYQNRIVLQHPKGDVVIMVESKDAALVAHVANSIKDQFVKPRIAPDRGTAFDDLKRMMGL